MCVCGRMCAYSRWWAEEGVYLAAMLFPPSGVNAGVGLQQFLNAYDR